MDIRETVSVAIDALRANKLRAILTSLGVIIGSASIVLVVTGVAWAVVYARLDPGGKVGQVVGNIVSEWTQILGIVVLTKYCVERGSKESG